MARNFDGINDTLKVTTAIVTAYPFTIAAWFNPDNVTADMGIAALSDEATTSEMWELQLSGSVAGDPVRASSRDGGVGSNASTSTSYVSGTWQHACGVFASNISRLVYLDGGGEGTNTTNSTPAGLDNTTIGYRDRSSDSDFMAGRIAEVVIWNVALTAAEVAIIARPGFSQHRYRPGSIVGYWKLGVGSPEPDWSGGVNNMTVSGATVADHVPIALPFGFDLGWMGAFTIASAEPIVPNVNESATIAEAVTMHMPIHLRMEKLS